MDLVNRESWKTDSIYAEIVKWQSTRLWITSTQVNLKVVWRKWPFKSISTCSWMHFCLPSYSVPEYRPTYVQNRPYLRTYLLFTPFRIYVYASAIIWKYFFVLIKLNWKTITSFSLVCQLKDGLSTYLWMSTLCKWLSGASSVFWQPHVRLISLVLCMAS